MTDFDQCNFATSFTPGELLQLFMETAGEPYAIENEFHDSDGSNKVNAEWKEIGSISVRNSSILSQSTSTRLFGFASKALFSFTPYSRNKYLRPLIDDILLQTSLKIAVDKAWDTGVVFRNVEIVAFKYVSGKLTLNSLHNIWTPERLQFVKMDYQFEEIPP